MKIFAQFLLLVLLAVAPPGAEACVIPDLKPAFWREFLKGPQRDALARGQVGIIDTNWSDAGLFLAWRHLEGLGVPEESVRAFWYKGYDGEPPVEGEAPWPDRQPDVVQIWKDAVKAASGTWPSVSQHFSGEVTLPNGHTSWEFFLNCFDPAFKTATAALQAREQRWGRGSRELEEWLRGQNRVFEACSDIVEASPELDATWPAELRADRQYQIAATDFYNLRYDAAAARFRRIAADRTSPWWRQAAFSLARTMLRQNLFAEAASEFRAITKNYNLLHFHDSANGLATYAELRADGEGQARKIETAMGAKKLPPSPVDTLIDARWLANRLEPSPERPLISFLRNLKDQSAATAYAHWLEAKTPTRLVIALLRTTESLHASNADSRLTRDEYQALVDAAGNISRGSAAYLSARYYRAVLLTEALGRDEEARKELDQLLATQIDSLGDMQRLKHLRAHLAQSWQELVTFGQGKPLGATEGKDPSIIPMWSIQFMFEFAKDHKLLNTVAITAINRFASLEELAQLQQIPELPEQYRRELVLVGFLRAALASKEPEALGFADAAASLDKNLAPLFKSWRSAPDAASKKFEAVLLTLKQPGMTLHLRGRWGRSQPHEQISPTRENWWCRADDELPADRDRPAFLRGRQATEEAGLSGLDGPNYLGREVLTYAANHPEDSRLPGALHYTVRATRFGCYGGSYAEVSKSAFTLLHQRFPKTDWAQKTPYWFK